MNAVRQSCRPKHQVLVLKCYPRFQKNQTSVKPNGSELSYLLYYASTRRSKLQKVGAFLEKRTVSDVWHQRIGNVQVSLQIVGALIEKCPRDLPLFAGSVLAILRTVLKSGDVTMVESTIEVWEAFCRVQDPAMLAADQDYIRQYEEVVQIYVEFAGKDRPHQTGKGGQISVPVSMRFRKVGLDAIKSIADSDTITAETARQLNLTVPAVLENLYSTDATYLQVLQQREFNREQLEKEAAMRRRQSISTVRTAEEGEADPIAALGTTADADKLAEQDVAVVAVQALRRIFSAGNRGQLRLATSAVLKFLSSHVRPSEHFEKAEYLTMGQGSWPTNLFAFLCTWAPVQDRFVILVTAMETLIRSPIVEGDLERQYVLTTIIGCLLCSTINFIGLSVMDVLVGLMQHISLLLQLGGNDSDIKPHHQQADVLDEGQAAIKEAALQPTAAGSHRGSGVVMEVSQTVSEQRIKLLNQLLWCIGNLATHVYYNDQISDMIMAILQRLKPTPHMSVASAIQDPSSTADSLARSVSLQERPGTDTFFSFDTARSAALQAVKAIITVANGRAPDGSSNAANRNQIGTSVWDGTQWLLRDSNLQVRLAYHDAIVTWLNLESKKDDLKIKEDTPIRKPSQKKENGTLKESIARRAVSNASRRENSPSAKRSTFIDLLHLAIYENAHQFAESEPDIILLHSLMCAMTQKLGVNATRSGLPMVVRLQDDVQSVESRTARINISSLVYGYFWALAVYFDFDASATARPILNEITARTNSGLWLQSVRVPPMMPHQVSPSGPASAAPPGTASSVEEKTDKETLKPFDNRTALVDKIAEGYSLSLYSPPNSPPGSPNRSFSQPMLGHVIRSRSVSMSQSNNLRSPSPTRGPPELSHKIRDEMMSDWTRDACMANTTQESSRSITGSGKFSGRDTNHSADPNRPKKHLSVAVAPGSANGNGSINGAANLHPTDHTSPRNQQHPHTPTYSTKARRSTSRGATPSPTPMSTSSVRSAVRIEDLKRVLAGATAGGGALRTAWSMRGSTSYGRRRSSSLGDVDDHDTGSDSLVSVGADLQTSSEIDFALPENISVPHPPGLDTPPVAVETAEEVEGRQEGETEHEIRTREASSTPRVQGGHKHEESQHTITQFSVRDDDSEGVAKPAAADADDEYVPPVPPLPSSMLEEQRGRQVDTDAESSIYMTPYESPAPPSSRFGAETPRVHPADQEPETPRAPRDDYFGTSGTKTPTGPGTSNGDGDQLTPRDESAPTPEPSLPQEAVMAVSGHGREVFTRRSVSANSTKWQGSQQQRKDPVRTVSSNTASRASYSGARLSPVSTRGSGNRKSGALGTGSVRGRDSMRPATSSGPGAGDMKGLLAGIDVDSWKGGAAVGGPARRPPY